MRSRHGAFDPGGGCRPVLSVTPALSFPATRISGGTIDAVTRLPAEPGPFGSFELPMRTSISCGSSPNSRATVSAMTLRVPVPMSCVAPGLGDEAAISIASATLVPSCQR